MPLDATERLGLRPQVVLADKYESYRLTYTGCHVFNPGRFVGRSFEFASYSPANKESEAWYVLEAYLNSIYDNADSISFDTVYWSQTQTSRSPFVAIHCRGLLPH